MVLVNRESHHALVCPSCDHKIAIYFEYLMDTDSQLGKVSENNISVIKGGTCANCKNPIVMMLVGTYYIEESYLHYSDEKRADKIFRDSPEIRIIYPISSLAPLPIEDMPGDVKEIYIEARLVFEHSPRAATALLRLAMEKLMPHVGVEEKTLYKSIEKLSAEGSISESLKESLNLIREIGNDAVHAGIIDLKQNKEQALHLFVVVNRIIEQIIVQAKKDKALHELAESSKKEQHKKQT